jgi:hypothetical protein
MILLKLKYVLHPRMREEGAKQLRDCKENQRILTYSNRGPLGTSCVVPDIGSHCLVFFK